MKRRFGLKEVVHDIRSGASDADPIAKYNLPLRGLRALFKKLLGFKVITHSELYHTSVQGENRQDQTTARGNARADLSVSDRGSSRFGVVRDISENGLRLAGIPSEVGEVNALQLN